MNKSRDGVQAATFVKDVLLKNVRVAKLNRLKFMEAKASAIDSRPPGDNWFKALINLKINKWASMNGKKRLEVAEGKLQFMVTKQEASETGQDYGQDDPLSVRATPRPSSTPETKPRYGMSDPGEEPHYKKPKVAPTRVPKSVPSSSTDQISWR